MLDQALVFFDGGFCIMSVVSQYLNDQAPVQTLNHDFESASVTTIIDWAVTQFAPHLALTCSFGGASGMVLLDLVLRQYPEIPVLVLDTDLLFAETYALIDLVEARYQIRVQRVRAALSLEQQAVAYGTNLYASAPERCCQLRKVEPLAHALAPYHGWLTAIRRDQSPTRATTPIVSWNAKHELVKICPLATWTEREIWQYIHAHQLPYNPLLDQGYTSLGCYPCTHRPINADPRSGRWVGFAKTECGLHQ